MSHRQKTWRLIFRFRMLDRWEVTQGLVKRLSFFLSGMHTMDPPMQGCFTFKNSGHLYVSLDKCVLTASSP